MRRALMVLAVVLVAVPARAQKLPLNVQNAFFFMAGCSKYSATTPPVGAMCFDTTTGGTYMWNGTSFVPAGTELLLANGGPGMTTATTAYFGAAGYTTATTTESVTLQMVLPVASTVKNLSCSTYPSPGPPPPTTADTFTLRSGPSLGGPLTNSALTCTVRGAGPNNAQTCSDTVDSVYLPAGSVIDYSDTTTGTPLARTITCSLQLDSL